MSEPGCTCIAHNQTKQSTGTSANEPDVSDDSVTSQPSHTFCNLSFVSSPKASDASCEAAKDKAKRVRPDSHECASCTRGAHTRGLLNEHASCTNLYLHIFVSSTMHNNGKPTQAACMLFPATLHMALWDSPRTEIWSHLIASLDAVPKQELHTMRIPTQAGQPKSRATSCQRLAVEFALSRTGRWILV